MSASESRVLRRSLIACLVVWLFSLGFFWVAPGGHGGGFAMAFGIWFLYALNPLVHLVASVRVGWAVGGPARWAFVAVCGLLQTALAWGTYLLANTLSGGGWHAPDLMQLVFGAGVSFVGVLLGSLVRLAHNRAAA